MVPREHQSPAIETWTLDALSRYLRYHGHETTPMNCLDPACQSDETAHGQKDRRAAELGTKKRRFCVSCETCERSAGYQSLFE